MIASASPAFVRFGTPHLTAVALTFLLPLVLGAVARVSRNAVVTRAIRWLFAAELIVTWALWYWLIVSQGWLSAETLLPMQLCDWAAIAALVTLLHPNQRSYELTWFWSLSGTLQALVTPDLAWDFPDLRFIVFFAFHGGAIAAALFLTAGVGMRPWPRSIPRVFAWSLFYSFAALATNAVLRTNFGYLSEKPAQHSLLDYLGPWPVYLFALLGLGVLYIGLLYAPFLLADAIRARRRRP